MNKKMFTVAGVILCCIVSTIGCGKKEKTPEPAESAQYYDTLTPAPDTITESYQDDTASSDKETEEDSLSMSDVPTAESRPAESFADTIGDVSASPETKPLVIRPGIEVLSESGISITESGTTLSAVRGRGIKYIVKNSNDYPVILTSDNMIVNHYTTDNSISWTIGAGEEKECACYIDEDSVRKIGDTSVSQIEFSLSALHGGTLEPIWEHTVSVDTGEEQETPVRGEKLYESDKVQIFAEYVTDDPVWGSGLLITAKNLTQDTIYVRAKEVYADGLYMKEALNIPCRPGTYGIGKQNFVKSILQENGQETFSTAGIILTIWKNGTAAPEETTGLLSIPVNSQA